MISIFLLLPLYAIGIQYERGGWWRVCYVVALPALVLDLALNYTELALMTLDRPRWGEWTFSTRLERLQFAPGWRGVACWYVARILDAIAPSGVHVKIPNKQESLG
jgi:hypothetical protein